MNNTTPRLDDSVSPQLHDSKGAEQYSLKGALVSSLFVGAFIVASWVGVFYLLLSRQ